MPLTDEKTDRAEPSTPAWFSEAVSRPHEAGRSRVDGAGIEWLAWGERGQPGVLLAGGNGAHMGWWRWIAPYLAHGRRVVALTWSGMGGSDWREAYHPEQFVREALTVAEDAGLFESAEPPVMVGHSFGGILTALAAATVGDRLRAAILIDARLSTRSVWGADAEPVPPRRIYPSRAEAIARFRLQPRQPQPERFMTDQIAGEALEQADGGWRWRADPEIRRKTDLGSNLTGLVARSQCRLGFIKGGLSTTVTDEIWSEHQRLAPPGTPFVVIPEAHHHVMLDQPLALVSVLDTMLQLLK